LIDTLQHGWEESGIELLLSERVESGLRAGIAIPGQSVIDPCGDSRRQLLVGIAGDTGTV
jgi:hypothetical protein